MTGLASRNKTLDQLRNDLRGRLGFITQGAAAANNNAILTSFLQEAHDFVYDQLEPEDRRIYSTIRLLADSYLYDWHDDDLDMDIDPQQVINVWLVQSDTIRSKLVQGITQYDRSMSDVRQYPTRYDHLDGQIELSPIPDQPYDLIVEHIAVKSPFDQPTHRTSVPDRLVFLMALATAKAHYRHPDAQVPAATFKSMLSSAKSKRHENKRYLPRSVDCNSQVVKTATGYQLSVR